MNEHMTRLDLINEAVRHITEAQRCLAPYDIPGSFLLKEAKAALHDSALERPADYKE